jgi:hypothetical protein
MLRAGLINVITTGTQVGTRDANSVWAHVASCDGTTASAVTDQWGATMDLAKVNFAAVNRSWWLGQNVTLGYQILIATAVSAAPVASSNMWSVTLSKISDGGFTTVGISPTVLPAAISLFNAGTTLTSVGAGVAYSDAVLGTHLGHFIFAPDGQFYYFVSRSGSGRFHCGLAVLKSTGQDASDTRNVFCAYHSGGTGRGAWTFAGLNTAANFIARDVGNSTIVSGGGIRGTTYGGSTQQGGGVVGGSVFGAKAPTWPVEVAQYTPAWQPRGIIPDLLITGQATIGYSDPLNDSTQTRIIVGDFAVPCPGMQFIC